MVDFRTLKDADVNVSAMCSKAIAAKAKEVKSGGKFAVGDEVLITMNGHYNAQWGRVMGYLGGYVQVMLTDRKLALFKARELVHVFGQEEPS